MAIEDVLHPWLKHYTAGPQWLKSLVGGVYAWVPPTWRYGAAYAEFLQQARLRAPAQLKSQARDKLAATLEWALTTVPAYRAYEHLWQPGADPYAILAQLPLLSKTALKEQLDAHVSAQTQPSQRLVTHTGGSTSIPMRLYLEKFVSRSKDFAFTSVFDEMVGIGPRDRVFVLRGRIVPGAGSYGDRVWSYDPIKQFVHLSSDHLEPAYMPQYVAAMRRWQAGFIQAFPSAIVPLARWLEANPAPDVTARIKAIQLYSENTYPHQIELLERVFGCPVYLEYGHSERAVKAISVPGDQRYFFWPAYGHVELIKLDGEPATQVGDLGEIVATGFDNKVMPMLRYQTGDFAILGEGNPVFPGFLVAERIEGRLQEFLVCSDRRVVSICSIGAAHFEGLAGAERMQFEQKEPGFALLKVISRDALSAESKAALVKGVKDKTQGGVAIEIIQVEEIEKTKAGKFKLLVQHLDVREFLGAKVG